MAIILSSCAIAPAKINVRPLQGPPVSIVTTPLREAEIYLNKQISGLVRAGFTDFVYTVSDELRDKTGVRKYTEDGSGEFLSVDAAEVISDALFGLGLNMRDRDRSVIEWETVASKNRIVKGEVLQIKIPSEEDAKTGEKPKAVSVPRPVAEVSPADFFITGSFNGVDMLGGGGAGAGAGGFGANYTQNRISIRASLRLVHKYTNTTIAVVSMNKQLVAEEVEIGGGRFALFLGFINAHIGQKRVESLVAAAETTLRYMLYLLISRSYSIYDGDAMLPEKVVKQLAPEENELIVKHPIRMADGNIGEFLKQKHPFGGSERKVQIIKEKTAEPQAPKSESVVLKPSPKVVVKERVVAIPFERNSLTCCNQWQAKRLQDAKDLITKGCVVKEVVGYSCCVGGSEELKSQLRIGRAMLVADLFGLSETEILTRRTTKEEQKLKCEDPKLQNFGFGVVKFECAE